MPLLNTGDGNTSNLVASLQASGGVTPVTTNVNYGVVAAGGGPVTRPLTFVASGSCGSTITASIQLQDGAINLGTLNYSFPLGTTTTASTTFSNNTAIVIPATGTGATTGAPANTYPSTITVAGVTSPVTKVSVALKNISHTFPSDVDVLLVGPTGVKFILMSDVIGGSDWTGQTYTFTDDAAATLPSSGTPPASGNFKPTNINTGDQFPIPAPAAPYLTPATAGTDTLNSAFAGLNPNGVWSLYVVDDAASDTGQFAGGWDLTVTTGTPVCNVQSCTLTCPANITVPADISGTSAVVNFAATPTGTCGVLNYAPASGSTFPLGTTTVNVSGANAAACSFTVTVTPSGATGNSLLISEFRLRGPGGATDEFVELYNNGSSPLTVSTADLSSGWALVASDGTTRFVVPTGTIIPAKGHYLGANSAGYSLADYGGTGAAAANVTYTTDIPDNSGLALFNTANPGNFTLANRLDAVGSTAAPALYREGAGLPTVAPGTLEHSFVRDNCGKSGSLSTLGPCPSGGSVVDTNNNSSDFYFVDTAGTSTTAGQRLGAPGPENLASAIERNLTLPGSLVFPCMAASTSPNRVRDPTPDPPNNSTAGTMEIRRQFTNMTGSPVTKLRFRIVDITTFAPGAGFADLRLRSSATLPSVANPCGSNVQIEGTTLETPGAQPSGGGLNSSLSLSTITTAPSGKKNRGTSRTAIVRPDGTVELDAPLPNGSTINVRFLLGVQQTGTFKFFVNVEALP